MEVKISAFAGMTDGVVTKCKFVGGRMIEASGSSLRISEVTGAGSASDGDGFRPPRGIRVGRGGFGGLALRGLVGSMEVRIPAFAGMTGGVGEGTLAPNDEVSEVKVFGVFV